MFFKILYYYYYLFYTRVIIDNQPNATVLYTLSVTETMFVFSIFNILTALITHTQIDMNIMVVILIVTLVLNYLLLYKKMKLEISNGVVFEFKLGRNFSIIITWLFFLISVILFFGGIIFVKDYLDKFSNK
jgi:hypothetical protein